MSIEQPERPRPASKSRRPLERIRRIPVSIGYFRGPRIVSRLRQAWVLFRNPHADIRFGKGNYLGPGFSLHMPFGGTFTTGDYVEFRRNFRAELGPKARVSIGTLSYMTYDVLIQCDTELEIGERCGIGQTVIILDGNHRYRDLNTPLLEQGYEYRAIRIEDDATVLSKCTVMNSIGTRSVIGANAVVSRPVPAYCLAAGVPARVIDYFGPEELRPQT
jgi:acetyltransferase-like isoleucine patch superfamily enzyme